MPTEVPMSPRVSVVLAARNEEGVVGQAVESILAQTLADWELVVVDDGSTDRTAEVIESFGDPRIRVLRERARGLPASLNAGLRAAAAPLVARQDADDRSLPERLERQVAFLGQHPEVALVGSRWAEVGQEGEELRPRARVVTGRLNDVLVDFNPVTHTTAMFRKDAVLSLGGYDETLPYAADYDLWLRLAHAGATLWNLDEQLAVRVMSGRNMSAQRERSQIWEELVIRRRDFARRRAAGHPARPQARRIAARAPMLLIPVVVKRAVRRRRGQAP